ncbi:MAG TPA: hypothetical protein VFG38_15660 [Pseudomonadales bacterium]|nr:hypothetical protein [Pseudomonadales bacterium]
MTDVLINIDVPDLDRAIAFYRHGFGLSVARRLGPRPRLRTSLNHVAACAGPAR